MQQKRPLGQTQLELSPLSFGAAPIGNLYRALADSTAHEAIQSAREAKINYFDTAPYYGFGLSERRLGKALAGSDSGTLISTKVGRRLRKIEGTNHDIRHGFASTEPREPWFDYSYDGVMRAFEESLKRLKTEHVHLLLAHDLGKLTHGEDHPNIMRQFLSGGYRAMEDLKNSGSVDAIGLGANEWQVCQETFAHASFDCFLLAGRYTLLDQSAAREFFPLCQQQAVSVILGGPFNSGILASGSRQSEDATPLYYDYQPAPAEVIQRLKKIEKVCRNFSVNLAAAALQFPLACPQICSVLAGFANKSQVHQAVDFIQQVIPGEFWQQLKSENLLEPSVMLPGASS